MREGRRVAKSGLHYVGFASTAATRARAQIG
jgi:hypothetical protein